MKSEAPPRITLRRRPDAALTESTRRGLNSYNPAQASVRAYTPVQVAARSPAGRVIGGLEGYIGYRWLFIRWLWIDAKHRRSGLGRVLIARAEDLARKRGAI